MTYEVSVAMLNAAILTLGSGWKHRLHAVEWMAIAVGASFLAVTITAWGGELAFGLLSWASIAATAAAFVVSLMRRIEARGSRQN